MKFLIVFFASIIATQTMAQDGLIMDVYSHLKQNTYRKELIEKLKNQGPFIGKSFLSNNDINYVYNCEFKVKENEDSDKDEIPLISIINYPNVEYDGKQGRSYSSLVYASSHRHNIVDVVRNMNFSGETSTLQDILSKSSNYVTGKTIYKVNGFVDDWQANGHCLIGIDCFQKIDYETQYVFDKNDNLIEVVMNLEDEMIGNDDNVVSCISPKNPSNKAKFLETRAIITRLKEI